jgi:tetratricopeptide (TPR) repeat protein
MMSSDEDSTSDALVDDTAEAAPATDAPPEDQILGMLAALMDPQGRARVSSWVGSVLSQSSPDDGVAFAWRAVRAARSIPDRTRLADVIWDLVRVSARVDDEALEREVLALAEAFGNSRAASWLANERAEANRMHKEAEGRQFSVIGREARRAEALAWAANALGEAGVHDQVAATARTALDIATETRFEAVRLQVLLQLAQAYGATNDLQALRQLETSVPVLLSDPVSKINVACQIADAWARRDTGEELTHRVKQVLSALRTQEDKALQAAVWGFVGQVWRRAEDVTKAMDCARRAVSVAKAIPDEERRVAILSQVAHSVAIVGDVALANEAAEAAAATAERVCGARERALALAAAASALAEAGQDEIALGTLLRALSSSRPAQRDCIFQVVAAVAQTLGKLGMTEGVWSLFQAVQDDDTWWGPASTT